MFSATNAIDATNESFSQGRMVNDATPGDPMLNAVMKIVIVEKIPHLCLLHLGILNVMKKFVMITAFQIYHGER